MPTCREVIEFLADYLAGDLPPGQNRKFAAHLDECPDCREYLRSYEQTIRLGKTAMRDFESELVDELPEALIAAILASR